MNNEIQDFKNILNGNYLDKCGLIYEQIYLNIFVCDKDIDIRCDVAVRGYEHELLMYDEDSDVRWYVAYNTTDKLILEYLSNDKFYNVSYRAKQRLKELGYE